MWLFFCRLEFCCLTLCPGHVSDEACTRTIARVHNSSQGFTLEWFMLFILVPRCFELPHSVPASYRAQIAHISHPIRGVFDGIWWGECWLAAGLWVVFGIWSWADPFFLSASFYHCLVAVAQSARMDVNKYIREKPENQKKRTGVTTPAWDGSGVPKNSDSLMALKHKDVLSELSGSCRCLNHSASGGCHERSPQPLWTILARESEFRLHWIRSYSRFHRFPTNCVTLRDFQIVFLFAHCNS